MKYLKIIIFCMICTASFLSCKTEGCTDCNAINYAANADIDDMTCEYLNESRLATYDMTQEITDPFQSTFTSTSNLEIRQGDCDATSFVIFNYGDIKNSENESISALCTIQGDSIFISNQIIEGPDENATTDFIEIFESKGYFSNDSIYLELSYIDRFDPYIGTSKGRKLN